MSSASMQIEVEVYKGPLSKEPRLQVADLEGYVKEADRGVREVNRFTRAVIENMEFEGVESPLPHDDGELRDAVASLCQNVAPDGLWALDHFNCRILQALMEDGFDLQTVLGELKEKAEPGAEILEKEQVKELTAAVTALAARMHAEALRWSMSGVASRPLNLKVRIAMVNFIVAAAEYGNQFQAKADAIRKQMDIGEKEEFPLSVVLKDTKPTDFLYLYDLMDASPDQVGFLRGGTWPFGADVEDRIKMAQRLFADHNWAKINTVHASGWGDVRMAFIKDDVGNWNLKGFDNRPGKLLNAYADVAEKVLEAAAKAAAAGATGGGSASVDVLLKMADQAAFSAPATSTDTRLDDELEGLRQRTLQKLQEAAAEFEKEEQRLTEKAALVENRKKALKEFDSILREHSDLVDIVAKSLVKN